MIPKLGALVPVLGMLGCGILGPSETPIKLTDTQWEEYWSQLEYRWPVFFKSQCVMPPALPLMNDVRRRVTIVEVPNEWMAKRGVHCTYDRGNRKIRVADDSWHCIPHELGHAACHFIDVDICFDFEHKGYKSQCRT